jgi:hypothetical protein
MFVLIMRATTWTIDRIVSARAWMSIRDDRGTVVETVVIAAGLAALAIATIATITMVVNGKAASISL